MLKKKRQSGQRVVMTALLLRFLFYVTGIWTQSGGDKMLFLLCVHSPCLIYACCLFLCASFRSWEFCDAYLLSAVFMLQGFGSSFQSSNWTCYWSRTSWVFTTFRAVACKIESIEYGEMAQTLFYIYWIQVKMLGFNAVFHILSSCLQKRKHRIWRDNTDVSYIYFMVVVREPIQRKAYEWSEPQMAMRLGLKRMSPRPKAFRLCILWMLT